MSVQYANPARVRPPVVKLSWWNGTLRHFAQHRAQSLLETFATHGDVVAIQFPGRTITLVAHPDGVQHILRDNHQNYVKSEAYQRISLVLGKGLITAEGDHWRRQRHLIQPVFTPRHVNHFAATMLTHIRAFLATWRRIEDRQTIDISQEMMRLTLDIIADTMFGADVSDAVPAVRAALNEVMKFARTRMPLAFYPERWIPTPAGRRFTRAVAALDDIVYRFIEQRRRDQTEREDLLGLLMRATYEDDGTFMNDKMLRDEVMTIFLAGHETSATALTWIWMLLSQHPATRRRLYEELDHVLDGRLPTLDDLPHLRYTEAIVKEAMRLYPPAWVVGRQARDDDVVMGYHIPAGMFVVTSQYVTHRHPAFWDNPEGFDPERWLDAQRQPAHRFAYFPFGGGPRICIGKHFAMLEIMLVLASLAQFYELDLVPGHPIALQPSVTLRPAHGMMMRFTQRRPLAVPA
nr:cytochrome P450 [Ardenticatena sp.]